MQHHRQHSTKQRASRPKTIYCILCPSFHGATLLSLLLSNHSRVLSLGDTLPALDHGIFCSCGESFENCDFWSEMSKALSYTCDRTLVPSHPNLLPVNLFPWSGQGRLAPAMRRMRLQLTGYNSFLAGLASHAAIRLGVTMPGQRFKIAYAEFLVVCARHHDFELFIDGYKCRNRYLSLKASGLPVAGVIHVLRDPRAFVASFKRVGEPVERMAATWDRDHRLIEKYTAAVHENVIRIRYEDLCKEPEEVLARLQEFMGLESEEILRPVAKNLHWMGNASLLEFTGEVWVNERWRQELDEAELATIREKNSKTAISFGYDLD